MLNRREFEAATGIDDQSSFERARDAAAALAAMLTELVPDPFRPEKSVETRLAEIAVQDGADEPLPQWELPASPSAETAVRRATDIGVALNAFEQVFDAGAPSSAETEGVLRGIPFAFKDVFATPMREPQAGSGRCWPGLVASHSSLVQALVTAGAVPVGATRLDPWCYGATGLNPLTGSPLHPDDPGLLVGGSSSGSAVAVAAGIVPFALGTDTGGSTRIPAALCGVWGLKPTLGALSTEGVVALSPSHDCVGILARDPALIGAVLEAAGLPRQRGRAGVIDVAREAFATTHMAIQGALAGLEARVAARRQMVSVSLPDLAHCNAAASAITATEAFALRRSSMRRHPEAFSQPVIDRLAVGALIEETTYVRAQGLQGMLFEAAMDKLFANADFVLAPVTRLYRPARPGPEADSTHVAALNLELLDLNRWVNLLGLPAVAFPVAAGTAGETVGLQLIGRPHSDWALLEAARDLATRG